VPGVRAAGGRIAVHQPAQHRRRDAGSADYTNVVTRYDEVVSPYTSGFLASDGNAVTNIVLQDKCRSDTSEHLRTPYDTAAIQITLNALGRRGRADPAFRPACPVA
jgi:triacylglycerol lipase